MKTLKVLTAVLALSFCAAVGSAQDMMNEKHSDQAKKSNSETMKCEVVDVACYINKGLHGEDHQACAAKCIGEGGELALLYDGNMYIPVDEDYHSARKRFVTKGGEMVTVTGKRIDKAGLRYIILDDAKKTVQADDNSRGDY